MLACISVPLGGGYIAMATVCDRFRTTSWTQIRALGTGDEAERQEAMEALLSKYWTPVYSFLRGRGARPDTAADLTQSFFADIVLERKLFDQASSKRGRLRTFLLAALSNYCIDHHRRDVARGKGQTITIEQIDQEENRFPGNGAENGESRFESRWAVGLLEEALRRCEQHFMSTGRGAHWTLFERRVLQPAISGNDPPTLADLLAATGFRSTPLAAAAVQVVKRRAVNLLQEVIAETVNDADDAESEMCEIKRHLVRNF